jgi:hypothetical protein
MVTHLNAEILHEKEFKIYRDTIPVRGICVKIPDAYYPVDVYTDENGQLIINGDEMDIQQVAKQVKQFYKAVNVAQLTGAKIQYNKQRRRVRLRMKVQ